MVEITTEGSPLHMLREVTCIFLYTYPTLLRALVPLLEALSNRFKARRIITLTYHLDELMATLVDSNEEFDLRCFSCVRRERERESESSRVRSAATQ